jgi:hypothetical protein
MFLEDTLMEYFCSAEYSPCCEAGISPLAEDIDWSLVDPDLFEAFMRIAPATRLITAKDQHGLSVSAWDSDRRSNNFIYNRNLHNGIPCAALAQETTRAARPKTVSGIYFGRHFGKDE